MMLRRLLLAVACWGFLSGALFARTLSPNATISLITCAPGEELYSAFGHSAFRVQDPVLGIDTVYNYGTFNFNTPNFYLKFMRGKLEYQLDRDPWGEFEYVYRYLHRTYEEQVLRLSPDQVQAVYDFLQENYRPENRSYLYDFFFDNCATRLRDIPEEVLGADLRWGAPTKTGASFRDYLHEYLTQKSWIEFGIDLVLGAVTDREANVREQMFLPDYLASAFDGAEVSTPAGWQPLVVSRRVLYQSPDVVPPTPWYALPITVFLVLLGLFLAYTWATRKGIRSYGIDAVWWFVLGLAGWLMLLLWVATDHTATSLNWNLLWAQPLHLVAAIALLRRQKPAWLSWYFAATGAIAVVLLAFGAWLPQAFPLALYPVFAIITLRAGVLFWSLKH